MFDETMPLVVADYLDECGEHEVAARLRRGKTPKVPLDPNGTVLIGGPADGKRIREPRHPVRHWNVPVSPELSLEGASEYTRSVVAMDVWHESKMSGEQVARMLLSNYRSTIVPMDIFDRSATTAYGLLSSVSRAYGALSLPRDQVRNDLNLRVTEDLGGNIILTAEQ